MLECCLERGGELLWRAPGDRWVKWVEAELPKPTIEGDEGATVTGDAETGFVVKPSEGKTARKAASGGQ